MFIAAVVRKTAKKKSVTSKEKMVPPRFELGSLDSKSKVLTITPWNLTDVLDTGSS